MAAASHWVAAPIVFTHTSLLAALAKAANWTRVLAKSSHIARRADASAILPVTHAFILTQWTLLFTRLSPMALLTHALTVGPNGAIHTQTHAGHLITWGPSAVAGSRAAQSKLALRAILITILASPPSRTLPLAHTCHMVTTHTHRAHTLLLAACPVRAWVALFFTGITLVTGFTGTGAMATVAFYSVVLDALALL